MAGKRKTNEAGSSTGHRADALRVLGVLKAATADQIQRLSSPHLTYRHTTKKTAAERKEARTASHRGALNDLRRHGLSVDGGRTRGGEEVRLLTKDGLAAAGLELDRGPEEMGGMPKSAGRSGASHAMTVNETVIAMIRPKPDLALVAGEPAEAIAAAHAWVDAPDGIGSIASYATEVALPATGTWRNPGVGCAWADIVLTAPEVGLPLLFIEADNCTEEAPIIAAKFDKYMRHFHRKVKDTDGQDKPMWRTRWSAPDPQWGDATHPPVLLVFNQVGPRPALQQMKKVAALTREHWQGQGADGFHLYNDKMPIVATTLDLLREHGPAGPAFWRFGREDRQNLWDAIGNPRRDAALARRAEDARRRQAQEAAEREAQRPVCADCGTKFTDDRWKASIAVDWGRGDSHPHLCDDCKTRALQAERQAEQAERERQQQERQEQEAAQASKAGGWLGRWRSDPAPSTPAVRGLAQGRLGKPSLSVAAARLNRMDSDDEQLLRGRIYGADHDHPGPKPGRRYAELVGGPLDGLLLDITGWRPEEIDDGVSLLTELGQFGPGGRALYDPRPGDPARWDWGGDSP